MEIPQELKTRYLQRREYDLREALKLLEQARFREIEKMGHQLKGNGEVFGYPEFSLIGEALEKAAQKQNADFIKRILGAMEGFLYRPASLDSSL